MGEIKKTKKCPLSEVYFVRIVVAITPQSLVSVVRWGGWGGLTQKPWSCKGEHTIFKVTTGLLWRGFSTAASLPRHRFFFFFFKCHLFCSVSRWAGGCVHVEEARGGCSWRVFVKEVWGGDSTLFNKEHSKVRKRESGRSVTPIRCPWSCEPARWWTFPLCTFDCFQTRAPGKHTEKEREKTWFTRATLDQVHTRSYRNQKIYSNIFWIT